MFDRIKKKMSDIAASINGDPVMPAEDDAMRSASESGQWSAASAVMPEPQPSDKHVADDVRKQRKQSILANAIDNRDRAVRLIVNALQPAAGSNSSNLANLVLWVQVDSRSYDPMDYAWADDRLRDNLRHALDNALLESVGSRSITIKFATSESIDKRNATVVVENLLYCTWRPSEIERPVMYHSAWISVVDGTGSMQSSSYMLDTSKKERYHIGRGTVLRRNGEFRRNDIVINESDPDQQLHKANMCVSGMHADIVSRNGRFWLKACAGGCRGVGGTSTKLIQGDIVRELTDVNALHPLSDGDMIELGKAVILLFTLSKPD